MIGVAPPIEWEGPGRAKPRALWHTGTRGLDKGQRGERKLEVTWVTEAQESCDRRARAEVGEPLCLSPWGSPSNSLL